MIIKRIIVFLMLILFVFFLFGGESLKKESPMEPGKLLNIDLKTGGSINISGWDKSQLSVEVKFNGGNTDDWNVSFDKNSDGFSFETRFEGSGFNNNASSDVYIHVPNKSNLKIKTMGGDITIQHVNGEFTGKTMGGKLKFDDLKGNIDMKTMGGEISLTNSSIDGQVKTMGGRVLLENIIGDISGNSMGGNVIYNNVKQRSGEAHGKVVRISTMGGAINVSDASFGANVHTMGGNIHVKSAKEFVKAKTMGGDIVVDDIDGWIKATTMGGDIDVTMTGDPEKGKRDVTLTSMGGDITLIVPNGLSMDLEFEILSDKNKDYKIASDFDFSIQTKDYVFPHKKKGKRVYAQAKIKEGKHKIKIKTVNGNINFKRSQK